MGLSSNSAFKPSVSLRGTEHICSNYISLCVRLWKIADPYSALAEVKRLFSSLPLTHFSLDSAEKGKWLVSSWTQQVVVDCPHFADVKLRVGRRWNESRGVHLCSQPFFNSLLHLWHLREQGWVNAQGPPSPSHHKILK